MSEHWCGCWQEHIKCAERMVRDQVDEIENLEAALAESESREDALEAELDALRAAQDNIHDPCTTEAFIAAGEIVKLRQRLADAGAMLTAVRHLADEGMLASEWGDTKTLSRLPSYILAALGCEPLP